MAARSEREKMLAGEPYLSADAELVALRREARRLTRLYNATTEEESDRHMRLLGSLLGQVGAHVTIEPPFFCDYGHNSFVGDEFYANLGCVILDCHIVRIRSNVLLGPGVQIYAATHSIDPAQRLLGPELAAPITIGDNVWIGGGAILCPGITIGANTTIGAGTVVTRDLPANVMPAGNPCRVISPLTA
jgi:maltose O-acetyltransferase